MNRTRIAVASLSLSAAALIGIAVEENFTFNAVIPTRNDRPTVGFGSTFHADGRPVKMGDTITPTRALVTVLAHVSKEEKIFQKSIPGAYLHQAEYDIYMDWVYQYGTGRWGESSMRRHILNGEYRQACDALLKYKFSGGYDCSIPGNKICAGVWTRQLKRHANCVATQ